MRILPVLAGRTDLCDINEIKRLTRTPPAPPAGESALLFLIRDIFILVLPPRSKENLHQQVSVELQARCLQTSPLGPSVAPGLIDVLHRRGN